MDSLAIIKEIGEALKRKRETSDARRRAGKADRARANGRKSSGAPRQYDDDEIPWIVAAVLEARRAEERSDRAAACERVVRDLFASQGHRLTNDQARKFGDELRKVYERATEVEQNDLGTRLFGAR